MARKIPSLKLWPVAAIGSLVLAALACIPSETWAHLLAVKSSNSSQLIAPLIPRLCYRLAGAIAMVGGGLWLIETRLLKQFEAISFRMAGLPKNRTSSSMDRVDKNLESSSYGSRKYGGSAGWLLVCTGVVLAADWPSIPWGYFESDDFNFLIDDRTLGFPAILFAIMNDHIFPLGRVLIRAFNSVFGTNAIAANCLAVGSLIALAWSCCLFLLQAGASRFSIAICVLALIGWTMWGEFTSGEYILLLYLSLTTTGVLCGYVVLRWLATRQVRYCVFLALLIAYACFSSISGFWVPMAAIVFLCCECLGNAPDRPLINRLITFWPAWLAILIPFAIATVFYLDAYQQPGGVRFLSSSSGRHGVGGLALQWIYVVATAMASFLVPIPHHFSDLKLMEVVIGICAILYLLLLFVGWFCSPRRALRWRFLAIQLVLGGVTLMVCLGRPSAGIGYVVPAKYLFMPFTWMCLSLAFLFDALWNRMPSQHRMVLVKSSLVGIILLWISHCTASQLGSWGAPFFESTRGGKIREHRREAMALASIRETLFEPLDQFANHEVKLPEIPGESLCREYPELKFPWGYEPNMSYFLDVLAKDPKAVTVVASHDLGYPPATIVRSVRESVSAEFFELLAQDDGANRLYSLPTKLHEADDLIRDVAMQNVRAIPTIDVLDAVHFVQVDADNLEVVSNGMTKIKIQYPNWESASRCILEIDLSFGTTPQPNDLAVSFRSTLFTNATEHPLQLESRSRTAIDVDLRQLVSFELSESIDWLMLHLKKPGEYKFSHLGVGLIPSPK